MPRLARCERNDRAIQSATRPTPCAVTGERRPGGIATAYAMHSAARCCARTAEIDVLHRCFGPAEAGRRPEYQLLEQLGSAAIDCPGMQIGVTSLEVRRPLDRLADHVAGEARCVLLEYQIDRCGELIGGCVVGHSARQMRIGPRASVPGGERLGSAVVI